MTTAFTRDAIPLASGEPPCTPDALLERLAALGIEQHTVCHAPVFTVAEAKALRGDLAGGHVKNLLLRNRKGRMWLVTCLEDRQIDLKGLAEHVGAGRFSFASPERLQRYLGVIPGAVSPFGVVNDHGGAVEVVLDRHLLDRDPLHLHPLDNALTTAISPTALLRFLEAVAHPPRIVDLEAEGFV